MAQRESPADRGGRASRRLAGGSGGVRRRRSNRDLCRRREGPPGGGPSRSDGRLDETWRRPRAASLRRGSRGGDGRPAVPRLGRRLLQDQLVGEPALAAAAQVAADSSDHAGRDAIPDAGRVVLPHAVSRRHEGRRADPDRTPAREHAVAQRRYALGQPGGSRGGPRAQGTAARGMGHFTRGRRPRVRLHRRTLALELGSPDAAQAGVERHRVGRESRRPAQGHRNAPSDDRGPRGEQRGRAERGVARSSPCAAGRSCRGGRPGQARPADNLRREPRGAAVAARAPRLRPVPGPSPASSSGTRNSRRASNPPQSHIAPAAPRPTPGKMRFRRWPDGSRFGWGWPNAGAPSVGHRGGSRRQGRNGAFAGGRACSAFFELSQRAGRIAPRGRRGFAASTR